MNGYRILSTAFFVIGMVCVCVGLQQRSVAGNCDIELYYAHKCISAHSNEPIQSGSIPYCEWANNICGMAAGGSGCDDQYGSGSDGVCISVILGSQENYDCYEDAFQTFISVPWYTAECVQNNAECNCVWTETSTTQLMTVCNCYDEEVED